jgi:hypothetical protein
MADNSQLWTQQRPGFRPNPPGMQRPPYQVPSSNPGGIPGLGGLTRQERQEAKRLAEEANFSFDGYQVVRREFIAHAFDPAMTIRGNSITFNNSCISKLEDATYIQFLINTATSKLVIRPCEEGTRDAIRWCVVKGDKRKSREISCSELTRRLYEILGWEKVYRYKFQGIRINYNGESLYLFDLSDKEAFLPQSKDPETGKVRRAKPVYPDEWKDSFGRDVAEHESSTQIDLTQGFLTPDLLEPESSQTNEAEAEDKK